MTEPGVVSHKSDYIRHPGESRGPGTRTEFLNPFHTLDTGLRRYDGFSNIKKGWTHYTSEGMVDFRVVGMKP